MTINPPISNLWPAKAATSEFIVGEHSLFDFKGLTINDRSRLSCYWVDDLQGFDDTEVRLSSDVNPSEDGEDPGPGLHGPRTMTIGGFIRAGSYPQFMAMAKALERAFETRGVEYPLSIKAAADSVYFHHPEMFIFCRKSDKVQISRKQVAKDMSGIIERRFQITLRASNPVYKSSQLKTEVMIPTVVTDFGRGYDRSYDLAYTQQMDAQGNPASGSNQTTIVNSGDYLAQPVVRFYGYMRNVVLTNESLGQEIRLAEDVLDGDYIEIDVEAGDVVDQNGNNKFSARNSRSDWMRIGGIEDVPGGSNLMTLGLSAFGGGAQVLLSWRDTSITG